LHERGTANAIQVGAYRVGMILGGGALLLIFARFGWSVMFICMAALLAFTIWPVLRLNEPERTLNCARPSARQLSIGWAQRLAAPGVLLFVSLLFCFRFGDAFVSTLTGPFLRDSGLSLEEIGVLRGIVGSSTSLLGALLGGAFVFAVARRTALLVCGLAQAASFSLLLAAALKIGGHTLIWAAVVVEGVVGTMATVALFTLMMDASDPDHAGTDYTLFASAIVLFTSVGGLAGGAVADATSYAISFGTGIVLAAIGTIMLVYALDRIPSPPRIASAWRTKRDR
jgi:predicted MFS family arabinose efflux permease